MLVDVVGLVGGGEDFGLVDEVDAEVLEDLCFGEVADAGLGHDRDGDGGHDLANEFGVGHAGDAALGADHGGNALQRHDGDGPGLLGDARLLDVHHVHDDSALEHLGEAELEAESGPAEGWSAGLDAVRGGVSHVVLLAVSQIFRCAGTGRARSAANLQFSSLAGAGESYALQRARIAEPNFLAFSGPMPEMD